MSRKNLRDKAIQAIQQHGALLVFPLKGKKEVPSIWQSLHPRTPLKWEWDESGDNRVFEMWRLMKELSDCREVIYSKWYQGRATFFSRDLFAALYKWIQEHPECLMNPPPYAELILDTLREDSPLSTKQLKVLTDLKGRELAGLYNRALSWNFVHFQIVGYGEADDGAFPSLVVGATELIYEDLVLQSQEMSSERAQSYIDQYLKEGEAFHRFFCSKLS